MILALLGAVSYAEAIKIPFKELPKMYNDPEYADTWRYTKDDRFINETAWEEDAPAGYKDAVMV